MKPLTWLVFCGLAVCSQMARSEDQINLEGARLFGNRDLPNITYVIPWKEEKIDAVDIKPISNLFDEALKPLDRDVFMREVEYYDLLQGQKK